MTKPDALIYILLPGKYPHQHDIGTFRKNHTSYLQEDVVAEYMKNFGPVELQRIM